MPRVSDERLKDISNDAWTCAQELEIESLARELLAYRESGALAQLEAAEIALINCVPITPYKGDGPLVSLRAAKAKLEGLR